MLLKHKSIVISSKESVAHAAEYAEESKI